MAAHKEKMVRDEELAAETTMLDEQLAALRVAAAECESSESEDDIDSMTLPAPTVAASAPAAPARHRRRGSLGLEISTEIQHEPTSTVWLQDRPSESSTAALAGSRRSPRQLLEEKPVQAMAVADVGSWLASVGLGEYSQAFADYAVDGPVLGFLNTLDLRGLIQLEVQVQKRELDW